MGREMCRAFFPSNSQAISQARHSVHPPFLASSGVIARTGLPSSILNTTLGHSQTQGFLAQEGHSEWSISISPVWISKV